MKAIDMVRRVDDLGRVALPRELRQALNIHEGDPMEIFVELAEERVILRKYQPGCDFCGSMDDLQQHKGKNICQKCVDSLVYSAAFSGGDPS